MLPVMLSHDFGDHIHQYATPVDPNNNRFEVLVERNNQLNFKGAYGLAFLGYKSYFALNIKNKKLKK